MVDAAPEKRTVVERWRWIGFAAVISGMGVIDLADRSDHTHGADGTVDGRGMMIIGFLLFVLPFAAASFLALRSRAVSPWFVVVIAAGAGVLFAFVRPGNLAGVWFVYALVAAVVLLVLASAVGRLVLATKRTR